MSEVLVLIRAKVADADVVELSKKWDQFIAESDGPTGRLGASHWKSSTEPNLHLVMEHYPSLESAMKGLELAMASPIVPMLIQRLDSTADTRHMKVERHTGRCLECMSDGELLSLSIRFAEPGYEEEAVTQVGDIFEVFRSIDGYIGSAMGREASEGSEVISLAFWKNEEAFRRSMPMVILHEVQLFEKIS